MPKRIAVHTIFTIRDGKRVKNMPGTEVDLTAAELEDIKAANPDAVRAPINESSGSNAASTRNAGRNNGRDEKGEI